jgi:hypothetical protein
MESIHSRTYWFILKEIFFTRIMAKVEGWNRFLRKYEIILPVLCCSSDTTCEKHGTKDLRKYYERIRVVGYPVTLKLAENGSKV